MKNLDRVLSDNLDAQIQERRREVEKSSDRETRRRWTNRYMEERTAEAGRRVPEAIVRRMRSGERPMTTEEWLLMALVLSMPPMDLLGDDPIALGGTDHDPDRVRRWIEGRLPLPGVGIDGSRYEWSELRYVDRPSPSHTAERLMQAANDIDLLDSAGTRRTVIHLVSTLMGVLEAVEVSPERIDAEAAKRNDAEAAKRSSERTKGGA